LLRSIRETAGISVAGCVTPTHESRLFGSCQRPLPAATFRPRRRRRASP